MLMGDSAPIDNQMDREVYMSVNVRDIGLL